MKKILGVSLALVMLIGSVPFGLAEPLRVQLEQEIDTEQIQCSNDSHVLVIRTNGKLACVTERTAERTGWEIISESTISQISYEYPLSSNDFKSGDETVNVVTSEPVPFAVTSELKISKLPKIGETAEVTLILSGIDSERSPHAKYATPLFGISSSFEFVGIPQEKIETRFINYTGSTLLGEYTTYTTYSYTLPALGDIAANDVRTYTVTIKAVAETTAVSKNKDRSSIGGGISHSGNSFEVVVMKDQTILYADFQSMYPDQVRIFTPLTIDDYPLDYVSPNVIFGNDSARMTDSELRAFYENNGYTNEQIEELVEERSAKASTQSFSPNAVQTISGHITIEKSYMSPSTNIGINDVQICLQEYDTVIQVWSLYICTFADVNGRYTFANVDIPSGSFDTTLDIRAFIDSESQSSEVRGISGTPPNAILGNVYQVISDPHYDITTTQIIDFTLLSGLEINAEKNRAFWIVDSIADTHDFVETEFGVPLNKALVGWNFEGGVADFAVRSTDGAVYFPDGSNTLYLDGRDNDEPYRNDDAFERWTIIHEYGHHMMYDIFGASYPSAGCVGDHFIEQDNTEACAWKEGWADVLPTLVDREPNYIRDSTTTIDFEQAKVNYGGGPDIFANYTDSGIRTYEGQLVEGRVGAAIWDIYDSNIDPHYDKFDGIGINLDDRNEDFDEIAADFNTSPQTFQGFYTNWLPTTTSIDNVMQLHSMDFVSVPTTQLPPNTGTSTGAGIQMPSLTDILNLIISIIPQTLDFFTPVNNEANSIVIDVPNNVVNPVLFFDSSTIFIASSILEPLAQTTYFTPLTAGTKNQITFSQSINLSNVKVSVDSSGTTDSIILGYFYDGENTPDKVIGLTASAQSSSVIQLDWSVPTDNGSTITGYSIERNSDAAFTISPLNPSYLDSSLSPDTDYTYRVAAVNANGVGEYSDYVTERTDTDSGLTFTAQRTSISAIRISFDEQLDGGLTTSSWSLSNGGTVTSITGFDRSDYRYINFDGITDATISPTVTSHHVVNDIVTSPTTLEQLADGTTVLAVVIDSDSDGIPDFVDSCPYDPETFNGFEDEDGCPDTIPPNQAPFASAGPNTTARSGDEVTLDGSNSYDPDDDAITYFWNQTDTSGYSVSLIPDASVESPTFTAPDVAASTQLIFELTVTEVAGEQLQDTDSIEIVVYPLSESREPDYTISHPDSLSYYQKFGYVMDTFEDMILIQPKVSVYIGPYFASTQELIQLGLIDSALQSFETDPDNSDVILQPLNLEIITDDEGNLQAVFDDNIIYALSHTVFVNDSTTIDSIVSEFSTNLDSFISQSEESYPELTVVIDEKANRVYLVDPNTTQTLAFQYYYGYVYLYDYSTPNYLTRIQEPTNAFVNYGEQDIVLFDSNSLALGETRYEYEDLSAFYSGLVHVYDDVPVGLITDPDSFIENPERDSNDKFGSVMTNLGTDKIAIAGEQMSNIYLYSKDGILINSYADPQSAANFFPDSMDSFGDEHFVVGDANKVYLFNTTSITPILTIDAPVGAAGFGLSISTNYAKNWILVGSPSTIVDTVSGAGAVYLFNATDGSIIHSIENPDPESSDNFGDSVSFVKNKILVGTPKDSPSGISDAGSVHLFSPVDGSLLESILNDNSDESFGYVVKQVASGNYFVVSAIGYDDAYTDEGKVFIYSNINNSPIATATADLSQAYVGQTITLDGSSSFDIDGDDITSYTWTQNDSSGHILSLYNVTTATPSFIIPSDALVNTAFTFDLVVSDETLSSFASSVTVTVIAIPATVPDSPTALTAIAISDSEISLNWVAPTNDGESPITGYKLDREFPVSSGFATFISNTGLNVTSFDDDSLLQLSEYNYRVSAINALGIGSPSNEASATTSATPNVAPILDGIGNQTTDELVELSFTATATDADTDPLTFSLSNGASGSVPTGATITIDGVFTWTPTESQDGSHTFDVTVTDGILSDSETIQVTVNDINVSPILDGIGNQTTDELVELSFTATATDADLPSQSLSFSLSGEPAGAIIDSNSGIFTWTPTESQDGSHTFDVTVSDGIDADSETITVTVNDISIPGDLLLTINNPLSETDDNFGKSIATTFDGNVVIGMRYNDVDGINAAGSVGIFNGTTGELLLLIDNPVPEPNDNFGSDVEVTSDGNILVSAPDGYHGVGKVHLFNGTTGELLLSLEEHTKVSNNGDNIAVTPDGNIVIGSVYDDTGAGDAGSVYLFNGITGELLLTINNPVPNISGLFGSSVASTSSGDLLISTGGTDEINAVYLFNGTSGEPLLTIHNPDDSMWRPSIAITPDDNFVIGDRYDEFIYLFNGTTGEMLFSIESPDDYDSIHLGWDIAITPAGNIFATTEFHEQPESYENGIGLAHLFNGTTGELLLTIESPDSTIAPGRPQTAVFPDGKFVVSIPYDNYFSMSATETHFLGEVYVFEGTRTVEVPNTTPPLITLTGDNPRQ